MKKITYNTIGDILSVTAGDASEDIIAVQDVRLGRIELGGRIYPLENGKCRPDVHALKDGRYTPVLSFGGKTTALQPLEKRGAELLIASPSDKELARIIERVAALEKQNGELLHRVNELTLLVKEATIFTL